MLIMYIHLNWYQTKPIPWEDITIYAYIFHNKLNYTTVDGLYY